MIRKIDIKLIFLLPLLACVEPVEFEVPDIDPILIVEGFITNEPGPHLITVRQSAKFGNIFDGVNHNVCISH